MRAGVGVAASQNVTDPRLGPALLDALASGVSAEGAVGAVAARAEHAQHRQLAVVDASGASAAWSGARALGTHGTRTGAGWAAAGNMLAGEDVLDALGAAFMEDVDGELEARLLAAMAAAVAAGGEEGPLHSAGLLVAGAVPGRRRACASTGPTSDPIAALAALWDVWAPQRDDYVTRALDPEAAPAYGVPGDPINNDEEAVR